MQVSASSRLAALSNERLPLYATGAFLCALAVAFFWLAEGRAVAAARPNVVLIQVDDMARYQLRAEIRERGQWTPAMPNTLNKIGGRGVELSRYYASDPICGPSRASLLSGRATHNHGMLTHVSPFGYPVWRDGVSYSENLPVWLQRNGYRTAHIGKYMNGYEFDPAAEVPPGWDRWVTQFGSSSSSYYGKPLNIDGRLTQPVGDWRDRDKRNCKPVFYKQAGACQYSTDVLTSFALKEISTGASSRRPFYMQLDYNAPHDDGRPPAGPVTPARLKHKAKKVRQNFRLNDTPRGSAPYVIRRNPPLNAAQKDEIRTRYGNEVAALRGVDEGIGRILGKLRRYDLLKNTYVIFTSDNGMFHGEHRFSYGKFLPHEPSTRQAFLVRGPKIPQGRKSTSPGSNLSIASTVLKMTGSKGTLPRDGRSMLGDLRNPERKSLAPVLLEGFSGLDFGEPELFADGSGVPRDNRAVVINYRGFIASQWKYVTYGYGDQELYDLARDPTESKNLAKWPRFAGVLSWARSHEQRLRDCTGSDCRVAVKAPDTPPPIR